MDGDIYCGTDLGPKSQSQGPTERQVRRQAVRQPGRQTKGWTGWQTGGKVINPE